MDLPTDRRKKTQTDQATEGNEGSEGSYTFNKSGRREQLIHRYFMNITILLTHNYLNVNNSYIIIITQQQQQQQH